MISLYHPRLLSVKSCANDLSLLSTPTYVYKSLAEQSHLFSLQNALTELCNAKDLLSFTVSADNFLRCLLPEAVSPSVLCMFIRKLCLLVARPCSPCLCGILFKVVSCHTHFYGLITLLLRAILVQLLWVTNYRTNLATLSRRYLLYSV